MVGAGTTNGSTKVNGAPAPTNEPKKETGKDRLVSKMGDVGAVLHEAIAEQVRDGLKDSMRERTDLVTSITTTFNEKVTAVTTRVEAIEKDIGSTKEAAERASASAGQAERTAAEVAASAKTVENRLVGVRALETSLKKVCSGPVPSVEENADGEVEVKREERGPEEFLKTLVQSVDTSMVVLVSGFNRLVDEVKRLSAKVAELEQRPAAAAGKEQAKEAPLKESAKPADAKAASAEAAELAKTETLEKKMVEVLWKLGYDATETVSKEPLQERVKALEDGLKIVFSELGCDADFNGTTIQERLNDIEEAMNAALGKIEEREKAKATAGDA
jgi:hypothetical protein